MILIFSKKTTPTDTSRSRRWRQRKLDENVTTKVPMAWTRCSSSVIRRSQNLGRKMSELCSTRITQPRLRNLRWWCSPLPGFPLLSLKFWVERVLTCFWRAHVNALNRLLNKRSSFWIKYRNFLNKIKIKQGTKIQKFC